MHRFINNGDMYMKYLVNPNKPASRAHLWDEGDTYCKMYSTGGMRKKKYKPTDDPQGKGICLMCQNVWKEFHTFTKPGNVG